MVKFRVGSNAFFKGMSGFNPHNDDIFCLVDSPRECGIMFGTRLEMKLNGVDYFYYINMPKDRLIKLHLALNDAMTAGKFLVPDVAKYLDFTIEDIQKLSPLLEKLDERHIYENVIFNSYIENGGFFLTPEQRQKEFEAYLSAR